ncbi:FG-GAP-like repeat-containing protein [Peribacillus simplex]|uniref:FG-GAP-like repeat-containing protein n=1 Tax=Peribacillus simplex TaxID=1478 RepID=UPI00203F7EB5|nr:FG-GAP-like repeat-containing protein [Peribacillus simplex]MCM3677334.1 FG-GAP-like repeat-containing protein [Peribacillus simplex]
MVCPSFQPAAVYLVGGFPVHIAAADFNNDGFIDLAVVNIGSNDVSILLNNGCGVFTEAPGSPVSTGLGMLTSDITAADFNGNGSIDLAVVNEADNTVSILLNNGSAMFTPAPGSPFTTGNIPLSIVAADFNGDGSVDLATADVGGTVSVLLNNGSAMFTPAPGSPFLAGPAPFDLIAADFNGNGTIDLAVANLPSNQVSVFFNNGAAVFAPAPGSPYSVGNNPIAITAADLNGDGFIDIATANVATSDVSILLNNGSGMFSPGTTVPLPLDSFPFDIITADFNCDGIADLATANPGSTNVSVLLNNGNAQFSVTNFPVVSSPQGLTAADLNGDGSADLVVTNTGDNTISVLLNNCCPPTIICPSDITVSNDLHECGAVVIYPPPTVSNCPGISASCNPPSGSFFPVGTTTVTCTATDASGNQSSCSFEVTVEDTESPTIICPADITVFNDPGSSGEIVNYPPPTVSDNCPGVTFSCSPSSGSFFPVGTTRVTCTAIDAAGNTSTCSFRVTVTVRSRKNLECILVQKVYDWVVLTNRDRNKVPIPAECFAQIENCRDGGNTVTATCTEVVGSRLCDVIGSRPANIPDIPGAQIVTLTFHVHIRAQFFCDGALLPGCNFVVPVSFMDDVILCFPEGTEINCNIFDVQCSVVLNQMLGNMVVLDVIMCKDVQVEAEVKLEVEAKFCGPRPIIPVQEEGFVCPIPTFPQQCPTFFPT